MCERPSLPCSGLMSRPCARDQEGVLRGQWASSQPDHPNWKSSLCPTQPKTYCTLPISNLRCLLRKAHAIFVYIRILERALFRRGALKTKADMEMRGARRAAIAPPLWLTSLLLTAGGGEDGGMSAEGGANRVFFAVGDLIARGFHYLGTNVTFASPSGRGRAFGVGGVEGQ
ncbi:hypothetical protein AOLI_G00012790 [Acnodon oligacanthus]